MHSVCGSLRSLSVFIVFCVLLAVSVSGQAPNQLNRSSTLAFTYEDSKLSDDQRATLFTTLAQNVPETEWPAIPIEKDDGLQSIIYRYYTIYPIDNGKKYSAPLPRTTGVLIRLIKNANGLTSDKLIAGRTLKIPPLPGHTLNGKAVSNATRAFDPNSYTYARVGRGGAPVDTAPGPKPIGRLDPIRDVRKTVVAISPGNVQALRKIPGQFTNIPLISIQLLSGQGQDCVRTDERLHSSPYYDAARQRTVGALQKLRAKKRRLALLDFDFQSGHGSRVYSAAVWLLDAFGVKALRSKMDKVELNRAVAESALQKTLLAYRHFLQQYDFPDQTPDAAYTLLWLAEGQEGSDIDTTVRTIPAMMLSAALWQRLSGGDFLSLSWRLEPGTSPKPPDFKTLLSKGSFVTVAAGNEPHKEVRDDLFPQSEASISQQFVNVTFGKADGALSGSSTSEHGGGKVDLVAAGCGFQYLSLRPEDEGSSYATPVVAVAAWLELMLDNVSAAEIRKKLIHASLLVRPVDPVYVLSGGVFDPARLIVGPSMHYLDPTRTRLVQLDDVLLDAGSCGTFRPIPDRPATQDIIVYQQNGKYYLLRRHDAPEFPGVRVEPPCELSTLKVTGRGPQGQLNIGSALEFISSIGHLTF